MKTLSSVFLFSFLFNTDWFRTGKIVNLLTSETVLWNGPSNSYDVHPSQHFFESHVTLGVTQWKPGVPKPNTSKENWFVTGKTIKQVQKYKIFWYFPKDDTCWKMSSNSYERFSPSDSPFFVIPLGKGKKTEEELQTKEIVRELQNKL